MVSNKIGRGGGKGEKKMKVGSMIRGEQVHWSRVLVIQIELISSILYSSESLDPFYELCLGNFAKSFLPRDYSPRFLCAYEIHVAFATIPFTQDHSARWPNVRGWCDTPRADRFPRK